MLSGIPNSTAQQSTLWKNSPRTVVSFFWAGRRVSNFSLLLRTTISGVSRPKTKLSSWNSNQTWLEDHPMIADFPIKTAIHRSFSHEKTSTSTRFPQSKPPISSPAKRSKNGETATVPNVPHGNGAASKGIDLPHLQRSIVAGPKGSIVVGESPKWIKMDGLSYGASIIYIYNNIYI